MIGVDPSMYNREGDFDEGTEVRLRSNRHAKTFELQNHHVMSGW
jgi:hypothetical protein